MGAGPAQDPLGQDPVSYTHLDVYKRQVQHDMLGLSLSGRTPKFVRNFMEGQSSIQGALSAYVQAVKDGSFPAAEHGFSA